MQNLVRSLRIRRFALFVYSIMVWGWGFFLLINIEGVPFVVALLLPLIASLPLLYLAGRFARSLRGLHGPGVFTNRREVLLYAAGVVFTVAGYALANIISRVVHHSEYVVPGGTLALGLHFIFLAFAFQESREYVTAAVFCLTAIIVPLVVPVAFTLGPITTINGGGGWMVVTSVVGLLWLGSSAVRLLISGQSKLAIVQAGQRAIGQIA